MTRFAETTTVEVAKTQGEIIGLVTRRGATDFISGCTGGRAFVAFLYRGFPVKVQCPALDPKKWRDPERMAQEERRQWRVMLLWVKAQLEAVDNGLLEPYATFMPFLQLADGRTVSEAAAQEGIHRVLGKTLGLGAPALPAPNAESEEPEVRDVQATVRE